jgi:hypothetical protein
MQNKPKICLNTILYCNGKNIYRQIPTSKTNVIFICKLIDIFFISFQLKKNIFPYM